MPDIGLHVLHVPGANPTRDRLAAEYASRGATLHLDPERRGVMANWASAIALAVEQDREWTVVLNDDAEPLVGWQRHLNFALQYSPVALLSLGHLGSYGIKAAGRGFAYATGRGCLWGLAVAIHRSALRGLPAFVTRVHDVMPDYPHDDGLLCAYAEVNHRVVGMTSRALFDHADLPSLMGHGGLRDNRRPRLTIRDAGPAWSTRGCDVLNLPYGRWTTRLLEALA